MAIVGEVDIPSDILKWRKSRLSDGMRSSIQTQITLSPEQHVQVRKRATELGISMAEYIRRLIDQDLDSPRPQADLDSIIGLFASGGSDIATDRTEAIRNAVTERAARKRI